MPRAQDDSHGCVSAAESMDAESGCARAAGNWLTAKGKPWSVPNYLLFYWLAVFLFIIYKLD